MIGHCDNLRQLRLVDVRLLEQPHPYLDRQDRPYRRVDIRHRQGAVLNQPGEVVQVGVAGHIHVKPRCQGTVSRVAIIAGEALGDQVCDGKRVADHEALEAPFAAQHVAQQEAVATGWNVV